MAETTQAAAVLATWFYEKPEIVMNFLGIRKPSALAIWLNYSFGSLWVINSLASSLGCLVQGLLLKIGPEIFSSSWAILEEFSVDSLNRTRGL